MQIARAAGRAIIVKDNRLLLVRGDGDGSFWAPPGGRCDFAEDIKTCVAREAFEETGLKVNVGPIFAVSDFCNEVDFHTLDIAFLCEIVEGQLRDDWVDAGGPVVEAKFFTLEEMKALPKVYPPFLLEGDWQDKTMNTGCLYRGYKTSRG